MYYLYEEVANKLKDSSEVVSSPGSSAFKNEEIIDAIKRSYSNQGKIINI